MAQAYYGPQDLPERPIPPPGVFPYTRGTGETQEPANPVYFSGYEMREQGATAVQELAETFRRAIAHLEWAPEDASRVVFIFSASDNFFEEIAKFRAARAIWANIVRDRFGAKHESSLKLRFHVRTSSCSPTAEQTDSNIIRTSLHALAAVLGGAQSIDGESAKRILQVIEYETRVSDVPDPFGGSYYLERLTADIESGVRAAL